MGPYRDCSLHADSPANEETKEEIKVDMDEEQQEQNDDVDGTVVAKYKVKFLIPWKEIVEALGGKCWIGTNNPDTNKPDPDMK